MTPIELKQAIVSLSTQIPVAQVISLYDGIVSPATIYRWLVIDNHRQYNYAYSVEQQTREWQTLQRLPGDYLAKPMRNKIVLSHQPHFYDIENKLLQNKSIKAQLDANRKKYLNKGLSQLSDRHILRGFKISGIHTGYSHFCSLWIKAFIEEFSPREIYDPCGGWGHRLIGAAAANCPYMYNDKWDKTVAGIRSICRQLNLGMPIYNESSESFIPDESCSCVFTCPPYFNIEVYQDKFDTLEQYTKWWSDTVKCAYKPSVKIFAFVINHTYKDLLVSITQQIINTAPIFRELGHAKSHLTTGDNRSETLVIFKRELT